MMAGPVENLARLACTTCRRQKRKCTRELPGCELCRKNRRKCEYPAEALSSYSDGVQPLPALGRSVFPVAFFLDAYICGRRQVVVPPPTAAIPPEFSDLRADTSQLQRYAEVYFDSVHRFFPIVSKIRFHQLVSSNLELRLDVLLLVVCMKLLCFPALDEAGSIAITYGQAKRLLLAAEANGTVSIRVLQSAILLSLYETAHAIYPAAYMTVGYCARLGYAMGIHDRKNVPQMFPVPGSWTEMEERRRVWWAVLIMDRYVNIGIEGRPFACSDAKAEDLLPMDEALWEAGEQIAVPSLAVSSSTTESAPPFARACQAAHLLSRVQSHINDKPADPRAFYREGIQLHHILLSFCSGLLQELEAGDLAQFASRCTAMGICYSARIALYDCHTCPEMDDPSGIGIPEQMEMQDIALSCLKELLTPLCAFSEKLNALISTCGAQLVSPFVTNCLYEAAKQYSWYIRETGKRELTPILDSLTSALNGLGQKWEVANEYLSILATPELNPHA